MLTISISGDGDDNDDVHDSYNAFDNKVYAHNVCGPYNKYGTHVSYDIEYDNACDNAFLHGSHDKAEYMSYSDNAHDDIHNVYVYDIESHNTDVEQDAKCNDDTDVDVAYSAYKADDDHDKQYDKTYNADTLCALIYLATLPVEQMDYSRPV